MVTAPRTKPRVTLRSIPAATFNKRLKAIMKAKIQTRKQKKIIRRSRSMTSGIRWVTKSNLANLTLVKMSMPLKNENVQTYQNLSNWKILPVTTKIRRQTQMAAINLTPKKTHFLNQMETPQGTQAMKHIFIQMATLTTLTRTTLTVSPR